MGSVRHASGNVNGGDDVVDVQKNVYTCGVGAEPTRRGESSEVGFAVGQGR